MQKVSVAKLDDLEDRKPAYALVGEVDLVVVRFDDTVSVFYGRCLHRGALMADGYRRRRQSDLRRTLLGLPARSRRIRIQQSEALPKFSVWIEDGEVLVDADEIAAWAKDHPQPFNRDAYLGLYADTSHGTRKSPYALIQRYATSKAVEDRPSRRGASDGRAACELPKLG